MKKKLGDSISKQEKVFLLAIVIVTIIITVVKFLPAKQGSVVEIRVSGIVTETYPLNENNTIYVDGAHGGKNIVVIKDGKVSVRDASCPDHICIRQGEISKVNETIICMPNQVVVEVKQTNALPKKGDDVDAVAK